MNKVKRTQIKPRIIFLKEGKYTVSYCPSLDLSTCGKNVDEARKRVNEAVSIFFDEITKNGISEEVLLNCGWRKVNAHFVPREVIGELEEEFKIKCPI